MDFQQMMKQAQQVQERLQGLQQELTTIEVIGESGGGMVRVAMTCDGMAQGIAIDPDIIKPEERETLEDLIVAAVNNAAEAKDKTIQDKTRALMQEMGLPEGTQLPGS
jgi:nucleoid-associated protein EbfC